MIQETGIDAFGKERWKLTWDKDKLEFNIKLTEEFLSEEGPIVIVGDQEMTKRQADLEHMMQVLGQIVNTGDME